MPHEKMVNVMEYTIREIKDGVAVIDYAGGSWAQIAMTAEMTQEEFDAQVIAFGPKQSMAPAWATSGTFTATAVEETEEEVVVEEAVEEVPAWLASRQEAYGSTANQIEFITEHGLEAWRTHVEAVKALFPKEGE